MIYIVMEYCGPITMNRLIANLARGKMSPKKASKSFSQLAEAVSFLHGSGLAHRDLKMSNIMLDFRGDVKLIDFGFSTAVDTPSDLYCGTPSYMAPEILGDDSYSPRRIDVWALGVIYYRMLTGKYPFGSEDNRNL